MRWWILEYLASEIFVLASEKSLSLATGLASCKDQDQDLLINALYYYNIKIAVATTVNKDTRFIEHHNCTCNVNILQVGEKKTVLFCGN